MILESRFLLSLFVLTHWSIPDFAHSNPGPSAKIIDRLGQWSVIAFCEWQGLETTSLKQTRKRQNLRNSAHMSAMLLLYDFASGEGPTKTFWNSSDPYTQQIMNGEGMAQVCRKFVDMQKDSVFNGVADIRYQVSATVIPFRPNTWYFAFQQNIRLLRDKNYAQFILGSFNVRVDSLGSNEFRFVIKNRMSRKSLFIGLGPRVHRPMPLGTTYQVISFVLTKEEILKRAKKKPRSGA